VGNILDVTGSASIQDTKVISGKALFKGSVNIKAVYAAAGGSAAVDTLEYTVPVNQIVELEELDEQSRCDAYFEVCAIDLIPKTNAAGEMRSFDVSARLKVAVSAYRDMELPLICDAYSLKNELNIQKKTVSLEKYAGSLSDTLLVKSSIDIGAAGIQKVQKLWCGEVSANLSFAEAQIQIEGSVQAHVLGLDAENQPVYIERQVEYRHTKAMENGVKTVKCTPNAQVSACDYTQNADRLDFRVELNLFGGIVATTDRTLITDIEVNESAPKATTAAALTIYFTDPGESVWEIARKYNTTVAAILSENKLSGDVVSDKMALLIPTV
jgi:LysM repeat protein